MLFGRVHAPALLLLVGVAAAAAAAAAAVASSPGAGAGAATPTVRLRNGVEMPLVACGTGGWTNTTAEQGVTVPSLPPLPPRVSSNTATDAQTVLVT